MARQTSGNPPRSPLHPFLLIKCIKAHSIDLAPLASLAPTPGSGLGWLVGLWVTFSDFYSVSVSGLSQSVREPQDVIYLPPNYLYTSLRSIEQFWKLVPFETIDDAYEAT